MSSSHCLNCNSQLVGEYCHKCGQPATVHRLSLKHFVAHDLVHGMWHVDRGLLYTLRHLLTRPGKFVSEYLAGKRVGHFNVVTLLLMLTGLLLFFSGAHDYYEVQKQKELSDITDPNERMRDIAIYDFTANYFKWILIGWIPILSLGTFSIFRRKKYYYTEHLVADSYLFAGSILIMFLANLLIRVVTSEQYAYETSWDLVPAFMFYSYAFWDMWKPHYSFAGWLWRFSAANAITIAVTFLLISIILKVYLHNLAPVGK